MKMRHEINSYLHSLILLVKLYVQPIYFIVFKVRQCYYLSLDVFVTAMELKMKFYCHWASSTGLTAVSKFKPRLPAHWAVGTHRKGPSRMEKVTSIMNWPIRNLTQIRN